MRNEIIWRKVEKHYIDLSGEKRPGHYAALVNVDRLADKEKMRVEIALIRIAYGEGKRKDWALIRALGETPGERSPYLGDYCHSPAGAYEHQCKEVAKNNRALAKAARKILGN